MIYTEMTRLALKLAVKAHEGQIDRGGLPYILHPFYLASQMESEESVCVALLHDVVEDTDMTMDDIESMGFSKSVIDALRLLTHDKDVPYMEYVEKIKANDIAKSVKLQDLIHNSQLGRLDEITEKDIQRVNKYKKAIELLEEK